MRAKTLVSPTQMPHDCQVPSSKSILFPYYFPWPVDDACPIASIFKLDGEMLLLHLQFSHSNGRFTLVLRYQLLLHTPSQGHNPPPLPTFSHPHETKVDKSFPNQQFKINGYKLFRKDRDKFGGGLMFYVNEQIPSKVPSLESIPMDIELILLEFTVKNQRWLCVGIYRPPSQNEKYFIDHLSKTLSQLSRQYDKTVLIGDLT